MPEFNDSLEFVINGANLTVMKCPKGVFLMSSPLNETGRATDELQHQVTISKDFYMSKFQITQALFEAVMGSNPSWFKGQDNPVESLNWYYAKEFCKKLNQLTATTRPADYIFDLPTEAQWEYACRAGTTTMLNSGKNLVDPNLKCPNLNELGWYNSNSEKKSHPVGQKQPNAWGIFDMHGNVWEWCNDWYGIYTPLTPKEKKYTNYQPGVCTDPLGAPVGTTRIVRGGSWSHTPRYCRSASTWKKDPETAKNYIGFRVALVPAFKLRSEERLAVAEKIMNDMVKCPTGTFKKPKQRYVNPRPSILKKEPSQVDVVISNEFYMCKYLVTQHQYEIIMGNRPSKFAGDNNPVEQVSWYYAKEFCKRLNILTDSIRPEGYRFDLPDVLQWEYACRAGTTTELNNGKTITIDCGSCPITDEVAWYSENSDKRTHPVGLKKPNAWGIYDMHGNVCEWCENTHISLPDFDDGVIAPVLKYSIGEKTVKGGWFISDPINITSSYETEYYPEQTLENVGFRVALMRYSKKFLENQKKTAEKIMNDMIRCAVSSSSGKDFYIGKYPVTQLQAEIILGDRLSNVCYGDNNPVDDISWFHAMLFCDRLNELTTNIRPNGYKFDLPTRAQWLYACLAGSDSSENNRKNLEKVAWYHDNSEKKTHPVGMKQPNAWGIYDMQGNVWEWCKDMSREFSRTWIAEGRGGGGYKRNEEDPRRSDYCRICCGGSYDELESHCHTDSYDVSSPQYSNYHIGFRLALVSIF